MRVGMAPIPNPSNPASLALKLSWWRLYRASDLTIVRTQEDRACSNIPPSMRRDQAWHTRVWSLIAKMRGTSDFHESWYSIAKMNNRLSTTRSARSRGRTLLSIDKNYARRVDTLYRKAFEAPGAIADEETRKRCRLAVMQELDGVCTVFLTHNDSSWPPTREQLKVVPTQGMLQHTGLTLLQGFQVLYPQDYISVNQANGMPSGREPESDSSGDDGVTTLKQPKRLDHDAEARMLTLVSEGTRDASPPPMGQAFGQRRERRSEKSMEKVFSPLKECINSTRGIRDTGKKQYGSRYSRRYERTK